MSVYGGLYNGIYRFQKMTRVFYLTKLAKFKGIQETVSLIIETQQINVSPQS
jgi:hypothetical protein